MLVRVVTKVGGTGIHAFNSENLGHPLTEAEKSAKGDVDKSKDAVTKKLDEIRKGLEGK